MRQPDDDAKSGDMIDDRYELEELIGRGGMGTVWQAWDRILNADVAVKLIAQDNSQRSPRLLREARACAVLQHPAIVRILAYGTTDEHAYIAMDLIDGGTLEEALADGPLSPEDAVRLLLPIIDALTVVHDAGVVHRDIKPENILMSRQPDGSLQPMLVDFGIAKTENAGLPSRLTVTGAVLGTPYYMSPEQAGGRTDIDLRTDIWSFCAVMYEAITGSGAFNGDNYNAIIGAVLLEAPRPMSSLCDIDEDLERMIMRGLEKDRNDRWSNAGELALALAQWLGRRGHRCDVTGRILRGTSHRDVPKTRRDTEPSLPALAATFDDKLAKRPVPTRSQHLVRVAALSAACLLLLGSYHAGSSRGSVAPARAALSLTHGLAARVAAAIPTAQAVDHPAAPTHEPISESAERLVTSTTSDRRGRYGAPPLEPWRPKPPTFDDPPLPARPSF